MARSVAWRRTISDACCWHQAEALNATIYILRETGPTGFLLKEEGETKKFKVYLGDPHKCTCPVFKKEKDLCKHISWLLLKKFRVPKEDPVSWQLGLVEREINEILRGFAPPRQNQSKKAASKHGSDSDGREILKQRDIGKEDVCPICQEELLDKRLPVTFCKYGCGNSVHIKCMKIWAEHQQGTGEKTIKCPMCREDFGPFNLLKMEMRNAEEGQGTAGRMDRHLGTCCRSCHLAPIEGKCYRCSYCTEYYLCQSCFNTPTHTQHSFQYKHKRNHRWRQAERMFGAAVPQAVARDMMNRELSATDYDMLLQLDNQADSGMTSDMPESAVNSLPLERVRDRSGLLAPGSQCRVCLRGFLTGQLVRKLPCKHKFHKDCIDNWLLHSRPSCPVDGLTVWNPVTGLSEPLGAPRNNQSRRPSGSSESSVQSSGVTLEVPGVGFVTLTQGNQPREDHMGVLRHRPPQHPSLPHRPPLNLELAGFAVGSDAESSLSPSSQTSENSVPGNRLLHRAIQHRNRLGDQLDSIQAVAEAQYRSPQPHIDLDNILRAGSNSAPPAVERKPPTGSQPRGGGERQRGRPTHRHGNQGEGATLRHRSSSRERKVSLERQHLLQSIQAFQDLYLGNNPRINPPQGETTGTGTQRQPANSHRRNMSMAKRNPQVNERAQRTVDIVMEGSHIDSLTLRDILR